MTDEEMLDSLIDQMQEKFGDVFTSEMETFLTSKFFDNICGYRRGIIAEVKEVVKDGLSDLDNNLERLYWEAK